MRSQAIICVSIHTPPVSVHTQHVHTNYGCLLDAVLLGVGPVLAWDHGCLALPGKQDVLWGLLTLTNL